MIPAKARAFFILLLSLCSVLFFSLETGVSETGEVLVVVDPGHGGIDSGAVGIDDIQEKNITLKICRLISSISYLNPKYQRFQVLLTRRRDKYMAPSDRIKIANEEEASLFVSIHINYFRRSHAKGVTTLFGQKSSSRCRKFARTVQEEIVKETGGKDRGVKKYQLFIRKADMPAIMIEAGFLSNPEEARELTSFNYQKKIAVSILNGINRFLANE